MATLVGVALCSRRHSGRFVRTVELPKQASRLSLFGLCEHRERLRDRCVMIRHQFPDLLPAAVADKEPVGSAVCAPLHETGGLQPPHHLAGVPFDHAQPLRQLYL